MTDFVMLFLLIIGLAIYFVKPKYLFIYWLGIQPYMMPVFFVLFKDGLMPMDENFLPKLYFYFPNTLSGLLLLLSFVSYIKDNREAKLFKIILLPFLLLLSFIVIQNFLNGFYLRSLYWNTIFLFWHIAPFVLLAIDKNVRPDRKSFVHFVTIFVYVQFLFCILNLYGFRIYGEFSGIFDDNLICGTFTRYNHMANFLGIFFFILSYEYYENRSIHLISYYSTAFLIGLIIMLSGSRMTLLLFVFTALYLFYVYNSKKVIIVSFLTIISLFGMYIIGNDSFLGQQADDGTGLERNLIGIIDLANSDDLSQGSTLALSVYLLIDKFNSPMLGNGKSARPINYYGHYTDTINETVYKTDARLAFMFVEYGVVGLSLFFFLFASMFKSCYLYSEEHCKYFYWGASIYFLLFSLTDNGFWDYIIFSTLFIYVFSIKYKRVSSYVPASK